MSAPVAFCPQCHNEVAFVQLGNARRCPICGFQYEMSIPGVLRNFDAPRTISPFGIFVRFVCSYGNSLQPRRPGHRVFAPEHASISRAAFSSLFDRLWCFRFFHEFMREEPHLIGFITGYQVAALAVAALGIAGFVKRQKKMSSIVVSHAQSELDGKIV